MVLEVVRMIMAVMMMVLGMLLRLMVVIAEEEEEMDWPYAVLERSKETIYKETVK